MIAVTWIVVVILFVISFAGLLFPIIPSILFLWGGFLLYHFAIHHDELSFIFWIAMGLLTILIIVSDILANSYFVKKYGGSKWGERVAALAVIAGSFILPPFGIVLVPFAAVFVTELIIQKDIKKAVSVGFATLIGFLSGTIAKLIIQLIMIIWFFIEAII